MTMDRGATPCQDRIGARSRARAHRMVPTGPRVGKERERTEGVPTPFMLLRGECGYDRLRRNRSAIKPLPSRTSVAGSGTVAVADRPESDVSAPYASPVLVELSNRTAPYV